jgi:hypothetical protein
MGADVGRNGDIDRRGIAPDLRDRVMESIPILTDALAAATSNPTETALDALRAAADELMRALGRVLIEIERQHDAH